MTADPGPMTPDRPIRQLFGVPLNAMTTAQVLDLADDVIANRDRLLLGVVNAAKLVNMRRDAQLDAVVRRADVILADGMAVVWAARLLRRPLPERVAGIDLMGHMLERGRSAHYRVFFLGATQPVLDTVLEKIRTDYDGVVIAGSHHGYFKPDEEADIAQQIRDAAPDMLFAAMSSPKKERFLAQWKDVMNVPVCHGVGGAFDVMAGKVRRAPRIWQRLGMEWFYRVVQEPRRMWRRYLITNTLFVGMLMLEMFGLLPEHRAGNAGGDA